MNRKNTWENVYMIPYQELIVWKKAVAFSVIIYKETENFPEKEKFGLTSQIRRAAVSIPSNIAEGSKRGTIKDYCSFLRIAHGSGAELETQIIISKELDYIDPETFTHLQSDLNEIMKMLGGMLQKLH